MHAASSIVRSRRLRFVFVVALLSLALPGIAGRSSAVRVVPVAVDAAASTAPDYRVIALGGLDATRQRDVPARLFWPVAAREGRVPLVLFSHGIGSADDGYTHLGRHWASHGIASLHVRHVGSDRSLWQGNPLQLLRRFQHAAGDDEAMARAGDLRFALDRLLATRQGARIDPQRIVVAGHSYGANTAMLLAGARVVRDGHVLQFGDPRIAAAILISAPPFYGDSDFAPILGGIELPTLHITTLHDVIRIPGFGSGVADREKVFGAFGGDRILAVFREGSHNVFTDRRYFDSAAVADAVKGSTQALTLAFLQSLNADAQARIEAIAAFDDDSLDVRSERAVPRAAYAARGIAPAPARGQR